MVVSNAVLLAGVTGSNTVHKNNIRCNVMCREKKRNEMVIVIGLENLSTVNDKNVIHKAK